jgi:hypothetical protein
MDQKLNKFNLIIDQKKNTYKNVCLLWKNYIKIKRLRFETQLNTAIDKLENIDNVIDDDISIDNLLLLIILMQENPLDPI